LLRATTSAAMHSRGPNRRGSVPAPAATRELEPRSTAPSSRGCAPQKAVRRGATACRRGCHGVVWHDERTARSTAGTDFLRRTSCFVEALGRQTSPPESNVSRIAVTAISIAGATVPFATTCRRN
jgi:hypothetical protein